jgi:DNA-binding CsgD family transcriptional regulator
MAGDGHISEEIGERLGLSVHTVNAYLGTAATKLDSVNRIQAIAKAIRLGYIT